MNDEIIREEIKEDYKYIKSIAKGSQYSISWSEALEMLNRHMREKFPERPLLTEKYIDHLMYAACFYNNSKLVSWLICNGANVNFQGPESGNTLLHLAALNGNVELAELLVHYGADLGYICDEIKANSQGYTYLHLAAKKGYDKFIQFIAHRIALKSLGHNLGTDFVSYENKEGNTVLHLAARNGHEECVRLILNRHRYYYADMGSNPIRKLLLSPSFFTPVVSLIIISSFLCVFLFTKDTMSYGKASVFIAYSMLSLTPICVFLLYKIGSRNESHLLTKEIQTPLHLAIKNVQKENDQDRHYQCVRLLIEATSHFQINAQDQNGNTALHIAAEKGLIESIKLLLKKKADVRIMTNNNKTALHLAIENSHYECAGHLAYYILKGDKKGLKLKLHKFSNVIHNKYDYYIRPFTISLRKRVEEKFQNERSWKEEVLCSAIENQPRGDSNNKKWLLKRELIGHLLRIADESEIDQVYDYAKSYAMRRDVKDGSHVLRKFSNFFRENEKFKSKNLAKLKKQESWYKDYTLYASNASLTILAILFILKEIFDLNENNYFINIEGKITILAKIITIFSFFLTVRLYFKHKELDDLKNYQDKVEEINDIFFAITTQKRNINSSEEEQNGSTHELNDNNKCLYGSLSRLASSIDVEEAYAIQKQKESSYMFSKSELSFSKLRKAFSDHQLKLTSSSSEKRRLSLFNKSFESEDTFQLMEGQPSTSAIQHTEELGYKKP